jgi:hypothetical protein
MLGLHAGGRKRGLGKMYQILRCYYVAAADNGGSQGLADRSVRKRGRGYEKLSQGNPGHWANAHGFTVLALKRDQRDIGRIPCL